MKKIKFLLLSMSIVLTGYSQRTLITDNLEVTTKTKLRGFFDNTNNNIRYVGSKGSVEICDSLPNESTPAFLTKRLFTGTASVPLITARFQNTGETAGGNDYQNEVHVVLQAGTSANHRRYINWRNYDGTDAGKFGMNAQNDVILYHDGDAVHRLYLYSAARGGETQINASDVGAVAFNRSPSDGTQPMGTGGVNFYNGGPYANLFKYASLSNSGLKYLNRLGTTVFGTDTTGGAVIQSDAGINGLTIKDNTGAVKYVFGPGGCAFNYSGVSTTAQNYFNNTAYVSSGNYFGAQINNAVTATADNSSIQAGIAATATITGTNQLRYIGSYSNLAYTGSNSASAIAGYNSTVTYSGSGNTASAAGLEVSVNNTGSGTITAGYGVKVGSPSNTGTITANYGLRVDEQSIGTTTGYGIYISGTTNRNYIGSSLGIGGNADAKAVLDIQSTGNNKGVLIPRMTKAQRDAISSPPVGLLVFVTDAGGYLSWNNSGWQKVSSASDP